MPRDPERIDKVLSKIKEFWKEHPNLRLGQIVFSAATFAPLSKADTHTIEDDDLLKGLEKLKEIDAQKDT